MLQKRVILDRIEIDASGRVDMRMIKQVVDGDNILSSEYHRSAVDPGVDPVAQMDFVNAHLAQMGWPSVPQADAARVQSHVAMAHTPEVVQAFQAQARSILK